MTKSPASQTKKKCGVKTIRLRNELARRVKQPGGISREEAISAASKGVESLRDNLVPALLGEVTALEAMMKTSPATLSAADIDHIFRHSNVIFNLAGTFGFAVLRDVAASLEDLLSEVWPHGECPRDAIVVHVRAARLAAPGETRLGADETEDLLSRLAAVRMHVGRKLKHAGLY